MMLLDKVPLKILIFDSMTYQIFQFLKLLKIEISLNFFEMIIFKWKPEMTQKWLKGTKMFTRSWQAMTGGIFSPVLHDPGRGQKGIKVGQKLVYGQLFLLGLGRVCAFGRFLGRVC